ncbi:unnamed protein product [Caenorhabditis brenneri]
MSFEFYEKAFAKSDKTDAILVVDGKKLHVNKAILSYHSDYFNALFNADFKEKLMREIPIKDVKLQEFATLLSLVHSKPIRPTRENAENILELAERFLMPSVKQHLEYFLIQTDLFRMDKIRIGDKYQLENLIENGIKQYPKDHKLSATDGGECYKNLSDNKTKMTETPELSVYEKTFAKSSKTDAILVVDGKKLHVNKAILSYHSDYFNTLFNSDFKEKSMEEIEIKDVKYEEFATLLSLVHSKPIKPTKENAENILELAERFLMPSVKQHLEYFLIQTDLFRMDKIRIGDKYQLENLIENGLKQYPKDLKLSFIDSGKHYENLPDSTKVLFLTHLLKLLK